MTGRLRVDGQQLDLTFIPPLDHVGAVIQRPQVRVAGLQLRQFLDEVVDDDRIVLLVALKDFVQHVHPVRREPHGRLVRHELPRRVGRHGLAVVDPAAGHLLQLARHGRRRQRGDFAAAHLGHKVALHLLVGRAVGQVAAHLDDMAGRQLVLVDARLQHEGGRADARHDLLQRAAARLPVAELAVDADEILLEERAFGPAEQLLVDHLALAEHVFQPVRGERSGQAPADGEAVEHLVERLEAFAGRVLEPGQFVEHDAVEGQILRQLVEVVVVDDDDVAARRKRCLALGGGADSNGIRQRRRPLRHLDGPHVRTHAFGRHHQPAPGVAVALHLGHGAERDRGLAGAHGCQDHGAVTLVQERHGLLLVWSKFEAQSSISDLRHRHA